MRGGGEGGNWNCVGLLYRIVKGIEPHMVIG